MHLARHLQQTEGICRQAREIYVGGVMLAEKSSAYIMQLVGEDFEMLVD